MIQQETILQVADNSGAKTVKCIKVLEGYKKKYARLGNIIVVSIQELRNKSKLTSKVKKGEIYKALVIRNKKGNPVATRVTESVPSKLKKKQFMKFINLSTGLL